MFFAFRQCWCTTTWCACRQDVTRGTTTSTLEAFYRCATAEPPAQFKPDPRARWFDGFRGAAPLPAIRSLVAAARQAVRRLLMLCAAQRRRWKRRRFVQRLMEV